MVAGLIEAGVGLIHRRPIGARVDLEQQVARLDELVVLDRQLDEGPGDPGRDLDDIGAHLTVAGPRVGDVVPVLEGDRPSGGQDDDCG